MKKSYFRFAFLLIHLKIIFDRGGGDQLGVSFLSPIINQICKTIEITSNAGICTIKIKTKYVT